MKRKLDKIFYPKSIAVIGASNTKGTVGYALMRNLLEGRFDGKVYPINLKYRKVFKLQCYSRVRDVPAEIDLAVIATPAATVPKLVRDCGEAGIQSLVIVAAGFRKEGKVGKAMHKDIAAHARKYGIRIIGPNSLGIINVNYGMNASFARRMALPGGLAFISQSGALCASVLDWSVQQNVGFSHFVSIGATLDVGFHDLIDYFGSDPDTKCILIYMESLSDARAFMSAARAFARSKPIIVLKAGSSKEGAIATMSHTGTLAGNDVAFEAAFRRAGIIRVSTLAQLFHCAQAVAMQPRPTGNRLAILTNAGGPGILATDYLIRKGGRLARFPKNSLGFLEEILPLSWKYRDPMDVVNDATVENYGAALEVVMEGEKVDGVLAILIAQRPQYALEVARKVVDIAKKHQKIVLACWMGEEDVAEARDLLEQNQIPHFRYPERAVDVFLKMYGYTKDIELLYETPSSVPRRFRPDRESAMVLLERVRQEGRRRLSELEVKALLAHYDIEVIQSYLVQTESAAV
ncbi:MAG: CoA-binding protein, partial [Bacteroidota bacterium]